MRTIFVQITSFLKEHTYYTTAVSILLWYTDISSKFDKAHGKNPDKGTFYSALCRV